MRNEFPLPFETVSVVVPVYNSCETLEELNRRITMVLRDCTKDYEILFVNDASTDESLRVLKSFLGGRTHAATSGTRRILDLEANVGQQNATLCGIRSARGDCVITLDDDLAYLPEKIPDLLVLLAEGE